jgi:hypothetical protein
MSKFMGSGQGTITTPKASLVLVPDGPKQTVAISAQIGSAFGWEDFCEVTKGTAAWLGTQYCILKIS